MIWYCILLLAVNFTNALPSQKLHPLSDEFIEEINSKQSTWTAGRNFQIEEFKLFKILASGVKETNNPRVHPTVLKNIIDADGEMPATFDTREAWPECADSINLIRDQSRCGASWAFAAVESMADRICIQTNGTRKVSVSAQDLITCSGAGGCKGGTPYDAWTAWTEVGIVTGGLYNNTDQGCQSFFLPPCENHFNNCRAYVDTPVCNEVCDNSTLQFADQKTYGTDILQIQGEITIQEDMFSYGPLESTFEVYTDFASYKSGIYQHVGGDFIGNHAVKMVGWGLDADNVTKYWIIANSWGESWGENGFFRLIRGQDEVRIESATTRGVPDFSKF